MKKIITKTRVGLLVLTTAVVVVVVLLARERIAKTSSWVVYVKKENRVSTDQHDDHMSCLQKIGTPYRIDDEGNLLIRSGYAQKAADICS